VKEYGDKSAGNNPMWVFSPSTSGPNASAAKSQVRRSCCRVSASLFNSAGIGRLAAMTKEARVEFVLANLEPITQQRDPRNLAGCPSTRELEAAASARARLSVVFRPPLAHVR
jgi:hypothetical protein